MPACVCVFAFSYASLKVLWRQPHSGTSVRVKASSAEAVAAAAEAVFFLLYVCYVCVCEGVSWVERAPQQQ